MTRLNIDVGTAGNPATGDTLRTAFNKINDNFIDLYATNVADGNLTTTVTNGDVSIQPNGTGKVEIDAISVNSDNITSLTTNSSVTITGNGTAGVDIEGISVNGTTITSSDSSTININENLIVDGTGTFQSGATIDGISITDNTITTSASNANLELTAAGSGKVKVKGILSVDDGGVTDNYVGFGNADDLKIFHNGSHSIIRETGTGNLFLQSDNNVIIGKDSGSETMIKGVADGEVELYHNNVKKLNTSSSGVTVVDELHTEGATPHLTLKRTDNANVPTIRFKGSGGVIGASIDFQGTSGTSNELAFQTYDGASIAERFRVTYTGAKVTGNLNITSGVHEKFATLTGSTGTVAHDCSTGHIFYHTGVAANFTANFTNLSLAQEDAINLAIVITQGNTAYIPNAVQIGGAAQTIIWQSNSAPTGTDNGTDTFSFTILNDGGTYIVLGQMVSFGGV